MGNRDRWNDPKSLRCHIVSEPFNFKYGGIEYTCSAVIGHYYSSAGLEPLRVESVRMDRKSGGGSATMNAQGAVWSALREFVDLMRRRETFEEIWRMACVDGMDCAYDDQQRAIEELERKLAKLTKERETYERMAGQPPATCVA